MRKYSKPKPDAPPFDWDKETPQRTARMRMAQLPTGPNCDVLYVSDSLWVPIAVVNYNVHVCRPCSQKLSFTLHVRNQNINLNYKIGSARCSITFQRPPYWSRTTLDTTN